MPIPINTIVFTHEDIEVLAKAARLIDIAYPLKSDPLVQMSDEAITRAVDETDQRRRAISSINPWDPVGWGRINLARIAIEAIVEQVTQETQTSWWLSHATDPDHPQAIQYAEVLAAERTAQLRHAQEAREIIMEAFNQVRRQHDPAWLKSSIRWGEAIEDPYEATATQP